MRNSLHIATDGLLRRGSKPTLGIASSGYLRSAKVIVQPPVIGGGGGRRHYAPPQRPLPEFFAPEVKVSLFGFSDAGVSDGAFKFEVCRVSGFSSGASSEGLFLFETARSVAFSSKSRSDSGFSILQIKQAPANAFGLTDEELITLIALAIE
jgi:hypothetical protein